MRTSESERDAGVSHGTSLLAQAPPSSPGAFFFPPSERAISLVEGALLRTRPGPTGGLGQEKKTTHTSQSRGRSAPLCVST